jgi:5-methylcytosine-specific restriction endonuclease McrA
MSIRSVLSVVWASTCRALMPPPRRLPAAEEAKRREVLGRLSGDCVYCGDPAETTDHFQPVIAPSGMPTGFCSDAWNVVPCCGTCNSSKSNEAWRRFMTRTTGKAPRSRGIKRLTQRFAVLEAFDRLHRRHAQRWMPGNWKPQLERLRRGMETAFAAHATRTTKLQKRIRKEHAVTPMRTRSSSIARRLYGVSHRHHRHPNTSTSSVTTRPWKRTRTCSLTLTRPIVTPARGNVRTPVGTRSRMLTTATATATAKKTETVLPPPAKRARIQK